MGFDLSQVNDLWASTPAAEPNASGLPDGTYTMRVEDVKQDETKAGIGCILWTLVVLGSTLAGRKHWHRNLLDTSPGSEVKLMKSMSYLKKDLALFGVPTDGP